MYGLTNALMNRFSCKLDEQISCIEVEILFLFSVSFSSRDSKVESKGRIEVYRES